MRALGLDLGTKRIGVAVSNSDGTVATPLTTLERTTKKGKRRAEVDRELKALVDEWEIEVVVVGMPRSLDGGDGPAAKRAQTQVERLGVTLGLPIETYDERFTTVIAQQSLTQLGVRSADQRHVVDQVAAATILQSWLDHRQAALDRLENSAVEVKDPPT